MDEHLIRYLKESFGMDDCQVRVHRMPDRFATTFRIRFTVDEQPKVLGFTIDDTDLLDLDTFEKYVGIAVMRVSKAIEEIECHDTNIFVIPVEKLSFLTGL